MSERIRYTLADLEDMTDDTITPAIAGDVLGCTGFLIGKMCQNEPEKVPFPFICIGRKTIIPRLGFIRWAEGRQTERYYVPAAASAGMKVEPGDMILVPGSGRPMTTADMMGRG